MAKAFAYLLKQWDGLNEYCRNGQVEARPIKGTARSNPDPARDAAVAAGLLSSEKDRAENSARSLVGRGHDVGVTLP